MQDNLDGLFSFKHRIDEAYVESTKYTEAAVAYEKHYMQNLCEQAGFSLNTGQSLLLYVK